MCRDILMMTLAGPGVAVEIVNDGQEALERFAAEAGGFDLLVTDHCMPRLDGLELVRRLRATGYAGAVVVVTSTDDTAIHASYRLLGVAALLLKPVTVAALRQMISRFVAMPPAAPNPLPAG